MEKGSRLCFESILVDICFSRISINRRVVLQLSILLAAVLVQNKLFTLSNEVNSQI